jgi:hypothetical protein
MKLLIEVEAPGLEHFHIHEPNVSAEVGAFVSKLVRSRTRGPEPAVHVHIVPDGAVLVQADALLKLQSKATAMRWMVEARDEREAKEAFRNAAKLIRNEPH